ncbi:MAG TPA: response regulator [bacterium]|nr:response regulator [bacterium]
MMPEMDGYEVLRQLKSDGHTHGIPVVFVSAKGEIEDKTTGCDIADYLTKPVDPAIVLEVVKRILTTTT